jgi:hypothetical protein
MADKDSSDKQPWAVPVLITLVSAISAVAVAWVSRPQQPVPQATPSPQAVAPSPSASASPDEQKYDLTGVWRSDDVVGSGPATFYVRQDGSTVWWYGDGNGWSHVLRGTLSENLISAEWANIPAPRKPERDFKGKMKITIISPTKMRVNDLNRTYYLTLTD